MRRRFFRTWLVYQMNRKDDVGEFARNAIRDGTFPDAPMAFCEVRRHLEADGASEEAIAAGQKAWVEWSNADRDDVVGGA